MVDPKILQKLQHYCAYQERCHEEVRTKLLQLKVYGNNLEEVIGKLIEDDFLNEERFAIAYSGGKFRMKKWGRIKITQGLKLRKISPYCINKAMKEIEETDYIDTIDKLIRSASKKYASPDSFKMQGQIAKYLIGRGFEPDLVWKRIKVNAER